MKRLEFLTGANFDIMGKKVLFLSISGVAVALSLFALFTRGLNRGVDFRGGTEVRVRFRAAPAVEQIRKEMEGLGIGDVNIQQIGREEDHELLVRIGQHGGAEGGLIGSGDVSQRVLDALRPEEDRREVAAGKLDLNQVGAGALETWLNARAEAARTAGTLPAGSAVNARAAAESLVGERDARGGMFSSRGEIQRITALGPQVQGFLAEGTFLGKVAPRSVEFVGPSAGRDLETRAQMAVVGSCIGILIYIWVRFRFIWGLAGVIALLHDVIIAMGGLALTQKEFSLPVVAALLTIIGYSINDTVVVLDRIRENLRLHRTKDFEMVVNASINQTFSRTTLTVFTVLLCTTTLYMFGGDRLDALSFTLLVGFLAGAYSSIFVASPILVFHERWWQGRRKKA